MLSLVTDVNISSAVIYKVPPVTGEQHI